MLIPGVTSAMEWTPFDIPTLLAWYRADTLTESGGNVTQWTDKYSGGYHLAGASNKPAYLSSVAAINNKPAVSFDGTNTEALINTSMPLSDGIRIYLVMQETAQVNNATIFDTGTVADDMRLRMVGTPSDDLGLFSGAVFNGGQNITVSTWFKFGALFNGASSAMYYGGVDPTGNAGSIGASAGLTLGARTGPTSPASFDCAEIVIVNPDMSLSVRNRLFSYFLARYGI